MSVRSERDVPALRLEVHASRALACALVLAHVAAAGAVMVALPHGYGGALAAALLFANGCWTLWRHALLLAPQAVAAIELRGEADCSLWRRNGSRASCRVLGSSYVATWLVILHLQEEGRRLHRHVVLAPDSMSPDRFRSLRVRLRWTSPHEPVLAGRNAPL